MTNELCVRQVADIDPAANVVDGELLDDGCELGLSRCTNTDLELMSDVYLSDVYGEHRTIRACPNCAVDNAEAI